MAGGDAGEVAASREGVPSMDESKNSMAASNAKALTL